MGSGDVIPVEETEIKAQGAVLAHLPAAQQPVDLLAAAVSHLQPPAAAPLELAHLLAEQAVIEAGAAGIKTAEKIDTTTRLVLVDNGVIRLDAVLVFRLLQRRNLPGTLALVATLQALPGAGLPASAAVPPAAVCTCTVISGMLETTAPRRAMLAGGALLPPALAAAALGPGGAATMALWLLLGAGTSLVQTPGGLLLRRSSQQEDRPALFAAQFALSHACWLVAYPAAGWLGASFGLAAACLTLAAAAAGATALAWMLWPADDPEAVSHEHLELEHDHAASDDPHHRAGAADWQGHGNGRHRHRRVRHVHRFVIDDHHPRWPRA